MCHLECPLLLLLGTQVDLIGRRGEAVFVSERMVRFLVVLIRMHHADGVLVRMALRVSKVVLLGRLVFLVLLLFHVGLSYLVTRFWLVLVVLLVLLMVGTKVAPCQLIGAVPEGVEVVHTVTLSQLTKVPDRIVADAIYSAEKTGTSLIYIEEQCNFSFVRFCSFWHFW